MGERGRSTNSLHDDPISLGDNVLNGEGSLEILGVSGGESFSGEVVEVDDGLGDDVSSSAEREETRRRRGQRKGRRRDAKTRKARVAKLT